VRRVLGTPEGQKLIVVGNAVGFLFAVLAFALSVISFPLLLDRNVGVAVAIITSIRVILRNPVMMALWGLLVAGALLLGSVPFFIGLAVVMPVLGHSTWHLYRKVVEPDLSPRPEYHPRPRGIRYAADFPVSLWLLASSRQGTTREVDALRAHDGVRQQRALTGPRMASLIAAAGSALEGLRKCLSGRRRQPKRKKTPTGRLMLAAIILSGAASRV
jgi:hypothetical protein